MNKSILVAAAATLAAASVQVGVFTFGASLSGAQEVPPVVTTAAGSAGATFDTVSKQFSMGGAVFGLSSPISNAHIHSGAIGANGPVVLPITAPFGGTAGIISIGPIILTPAQEAALLSENWYINIHTSNFPGGEIRGQLLITAVPEPETYAAMAGAALVAFGVWRRARR